ncbi:hypothetical protein GCM10027424_04440 [Psychrobacter pacificensis]
MPVELKLILDQEKPNSAFGLSYLMSDFVGWALAQRFNFIECEIDEMSSLCLLFYYLQFAGKYFLSIGSVAPGAQTQVIPLSAPVPVN